MKKHLSAWIGLAVFVCIIAAVCMGIADMRHRNSERQLIIQKKAVERAAVLCYALEGFYPPRIEYLEKKYGLIVNRDKFIVLYKTFGSNIRPEISIYPGFKNLEKINE